MKNRKPAILFLISMFGLLVAFVGTIMSYLDFGVIVEIDELAPSTSSGIIIAVGLAVFFVCIAFSALSVSSP